MEKFFLIFLGAIVFIGSCITQPRPFEVNDCVVMPTTDLGQCYGLVEKIMTDSEGYDTVVASFHVCDQAFFVMPMRVVERVQDSRIERTPCE